LLRQFSLGPLDASVITVSCVFSQQARRYSRKSAAAAQYLRQRVPMWRDVTEFMAGRTGLSFLVDGELEEPY